MTTAESVHEHHPDGFYKAIMAENVVFLTTRENRRLVSLPLKSLRWIDLSDRGLAILPIHLAATYRKAQSIEVLLEAGADPEQRDQRGRNALHLVITHWPNIVPAWPAARTKLRVTMETMQQRAEDCLRVLCERGMDLNACVGGDSDTRQTALHLAVRYGALPAVAMLASYGANVNLADTVGMTPLHMAAGVLHTDIVACLIELGGDVNRVVESSRNTPLHLATRAAASSFTNTHADSAGCLTAILEGGAELEAVNKQGWTALHMACSVGKENVVDLLLRYGADVNKVTANGQNCLYLFLEHRPNLSKKRLLGKLLYLTVPLKLTNSLPRCLRTTEYAKQRSQLANFSQQPRALQDLCKIRAYQLYGEGDKPLLGDLLPPRIIDFIFDYWDSPVEIDFDTDDDKPRRPNAHHFVPPPDFWNVHFPHFPRPPNFPNHTRPNFANNPPNAQNAPRDFPNVNSNSNPPRDFPHLQEMYANISQDLENMMRDFGQGNAPRPSATLANISQNLENIMQDHFRQGSTARPSANTRQGAPSTGQRMPNTEQNLPNTEQNFPTTRYHSNHQIFTFTTETNTTTTPRFPNATTQGVPSAGQAGARNTPGSTPIRPGSIPAFRSPLISGIPFHSVPSPFPNVTQRSGFTFTTDDLGNIPTFSNLPNFSFN
ncbi:ankyrin repeat domain-containing protein 61-like isoform X2 [Engraulis encrasicolus]|uniref:ankyrin repeat domain-containing protein 61-like isoform X2 n=1 Tax=Engraulis encrasicolus TaxID=184585 RepID=UPI002FD31837